MNIYDHHGKPININIYEKEEQELAKRFIKKDDVVLELGARYGSVSCVINHNLRCKTNQVVVEPDERVWEALERNKKENHCGFHIVKGFLSSKPLGLVIPNSTYGYETTSKEDIGSTISFYSLEAIQDKYKLTFNVLVADCEGFLEQFIDENPTLLTTLRLILFEADCPEKCDYKKIKSILEKNDFIEYKKGFQNVWEKLT